MITLSLEELQTICINIWNCSSEGDNGEYSYYSDEENNETIKKLVSIELNNIGKEYQECKQIVQNLQRN